MERNETAKKRIKPKYNTWSNTLWMLARAWRSDKSVLGVTALIVLLGTVQSLLQLLAAPMVVRAVENALPLPRLLGVIFAFAGGLVLCAAALGYLEQLSACGTLGQRLDLLRGRLRKQVLTSYPNLQDPAFHAMAQRSVEACASDNSGTQHFWQAFVELFTAVLCFAVWAVLLADAGVFLTVLVLVTAALGYLSDHLGMRWHWLHKEEETAHYQRMDYITARTRDKALAKDIRVYRMQDWLTAQLRQAVQGLESYARRRTARRFAGSAAAPVLGLLRTLAVSAVLLGRVLDGQLTAAGFLLTFSAAAALADRVTDILACASRLTGDSFQISQVREFAEWPEPFLFGAGAAIPVPPDGRYTLELRNVSYRYPGAEREVFSHIDLTLAPGEKLAVVGLNGAGKTTLVRLLCGFLDPTEGAVLLNGQDIRQYDRRQYYALFSAVWQQYAVLAASIAENVAGLPADDPGFDRQRVRTCLEQAGLAEKIAALPKGEDTLLRKEVWLEAEQLSGGETQRLLLARALYRDAPLILLDEPTAALDPIAESQLYQRYSDMTAGKSAVYVSHRLASTRFCDRIILVADGGFAEIGTHEELLAANGRYAHLYRVQSRYYKEGKEDFGEGEE